MAGRYYDPETGEFVAEVEGKNGKVRKPTIRDARENSLVPSVTTMLDVVNKEGLNRWKENNLINAAIEYMEIACNIAVDQQEVARLIRKEAEQYTIEARESGTAYHKAIEEMLLPHISMPHAEEIKWHRTRRISPIVKDEIMVSLASFLADMKVRPWQLEFSMINDYFQYACTADFVGSYDGKSSIIDWKTKDTDENFRLSFRPEWGAQLAANKRAYEDCNHGKIQQCVSVIVSKTEPGVIYTKVWGDEEISKLFAAFMHAADLWRSPLYKNYEVERW